MVKPSIGRSPANIFELRVGDSPSMVDDIENDTKSPTRVRRTAT
jgi:hypothetical protein